jgi:hypothetical protein
MLPKTFWIFVAQIQEFEKKAFLWKLILPHYRIYISIADCFNSADKQIGDKT